METTADPRTEAFLAAIPSATRRRDATTLIGLMRRVTVGRAVPRAARASTADALVTG